MYNEKSLERHVFCQTHLSQTVVLIVIASVKMIRISNAVPPELLLLSFVVRRNVAET